MLDGPSSAEARRIIEKLQTAGFVAYLAGGCVRDALLGREPKDYDVATDATPDAVRELFGQRRTLAFGASFGVIGVLPERRRLAGRVEPTEVATFRSDGDYSDGRRPDSVHFGNARQDALRRDFTINGMFYDPSRHEVIDYVGGQIDIDQAKLRTIGDPVDRFGEDKLRMLRAIRFATTLGFAIEPATMAAIGQHADDIHVVSGERIGAEMRRVLADPHAAVGLQQLMRCGLHHVVLPELTSADLDRYRTLISKIQASDFPKSLACLLTVVDCGQRALGDIASRWRLSNEEVRMVTAALKYWPTIAGAHRLTWSVVQPVLIHRDARIIIALASAIVATDGEDPEGIERADQALELPDDQLNPPALITGDELGRLGIPPGPQYREILQTIRDAQLDGKIDSAEQAVQWVDQLRQSGLHP